MALPSKMYTSAIAPNGSSEKTITRHSTRLKSLFFMRFFSFLSSEWACFIVKASSASLTAAVSAPDRSRRCLSSQKQCKHSFWRFWWAPPFFLSKSNPGLWFGLDGLKIIRGNAIYIKTKMFVRGLIWFPIYGFWRSRIHLLFKQQGGKIRILSSVGP